MSNIYDFIKQFDYSNIVSIGDAFNKLKTVTDFIGDAHVGIAELKQRGAATGPDMSELLADLNSAQIVKAAVETRINELQADLRSQEVISTPEVIFAELAAHDEPGYTLFVAHLRSKYPNISWLARLPS